MSTSRKVVTERWPGGPIRNPAHERRALKAWDTRRMRYGPSGMKNPKPPKVSTRKRKPHPERDTSSPLFAPLVRRGPRP